MDVSASARLKHVNSHIGASPVAHHGDGSVVGAVSFLSLLRLLAAPALSAAALRLPLSTLLLLPVLSLPLASPA